MWIYRDIEGLKCLTTRIKQAIQVSLTCCNIPQAFSVKVFTVI